MVNLHFPLIDVKLDNSVAFIKENYRNCYLCRYNNLYFIYYKNRQDKLKK